ncbi:YfjI family protein [Spongiactinospora sp. TRM90649]|uniref:YfjI family protein n=1 Tax=Spongiactinospora sp. TRM90649 TaxID=3031114 RepID=UPI0023F9A955|nr:YfjI family protein [Spongiactinospora sp. TRM90649]MDF5756619.1 YfjI family protein [Spongiactinospora sp. TRM90649]
MSSAAPRQVRLRADLEAAREWLRRLHGGHPGLINICATGTWAGRCFATDESGIDSAVGYIDWLDQRSREGIYARVTTLATAPGRGKRGGADASLSLPGLWADIDIAGPGHKATVLPLPPDGETAMRLVAEAGLPEPTLWIHSGGGLYPWWLLAEPATVTAETFATLSALSAHWQHALDAAAKRLRHHYGEGVGDLSRVLRIPGTINRKEGLARPCRVLEERSTGTLYLLADLEAALHQIGLEASELPKTAPQRGKPPMPRTPPHARAQRVPRPAEGPVGPFDALAETATWADLLTPAGFTFVRSEGNGAELWKYAGSSAASEYSVRCGLDGTPVLVNHSESTPLPVGAGHRLTMGRTFAHLHHGGDERAAARDLLDAATGHAPEGSPTATLPARVLEHIAARCAPSPRQGDTGDWREAPWPQDARPRATPHARQMAGGHERQAQQNGGQHDVRQAMTAADESAIARGVFATREALRALPWSAPGTDARPVVLPVFPVGSLPGDIGKFAEAVATYMQISVDITALAILGVLAVLAGNHATISGQWKENTLNLYLAALADSGEGKSPAVSMIVAPVYELETTLRSAWDAEFGERAEQHEIAVRTKDRLVAKIADAHGGQRDNLMADLDSLKAEIADTTAPPRPQLLAGDVTPEVLGKIMHRTGGHIGVISAEGGLLGNLSGRYSKGVPNIELVLTAYDSSEPYRLERITRDPFEVERPSLSISLAVQPVVVNDALASAALSDRGLLNRFLFAAPESLAGHRDKAPPQVPQHLREMWRTTVFSVHRTLLPTGRACDEQGRPAEPVHMSVAAEAEELHLAWRIELEGRVDPDSGDLAPIKGWAKKLEGVAYRLAALLHLAAGADPRTPVSEATMRHALEVADWAIPHAQAVFGRAADGGAVGAAPGLPAGAIGQQAAHVLDWIRRKGVREFTADGARTALRGRAWVKEGGAGAVRAALTVLAQTGWLATVARRGSDGRRLTDAVYVPHPDVHRPRVAGT